MKTIRLTEAPPAEPVDQVRARLRARRRNTQAIADAVPGAGDNALDDLRAIDYLDHAKRRHGILTEQARGMVYRPATGEDDGEVEYVVDPPETDQPESNVHVVEGWA